MPAQATQPPEWADWLDRFGWPGLTVLILIWVGRGLWSWLKPHLDNWIALQVKKQEAETERHKVQSESIKRLTDKTIELQQLTANSVSDLKRDLDKTCRYKKP